MEHQKTSNRIYHVPGEETKRKGEGEVEVEVEVERMYRGLLSSKVQSQSEIEFTPRNIMFSRGFLCDE